MKNLYPLASELSNETKFIFQEKENTNAETAKESPEELDKKALEGLGFVEGDAKNPEAVNTNLQTFEGLQFMDANNWQLDKGFNAVSAVMINSTGRLQVFAHDNAGNKKMFSFKPNGKSDFQKEYK